MKPLNVFHCALNWGISDFEKIKKLCFFSIANPVSSYFQYIYEHCFTSRLRNIRMKDEKKK